MIKHDSKDITISQKIFVFFLLVYTKTLSGTTVFKIDKRRMSMLERSLNDHATLKTSEMTTKKNHLCQKLPFVKITFLNILKSESYFDL